MAVDYTSWDSDPANNGTGSPPYRYPTGTFRGSDVDDSFRVVGAGIRSLGDIAAKLPLNEDDTVNEGPNDGRLGTIAFLDETDFDPATGDLANKTRKVAGKDLRIFYGTLVEAAAEATYGWAICDGRVQNGVTTPDLREKFPMFYSASIAPKATGGATSKTTAAGGNHDHGGATGSHSLTTAELPSGSYVRTVTIAESGSGSSVETGDERLITTTVSGSGSGHTHSISSSGTHTHSISDVRPPYVALVPLLYVGVA